MNGLFGGNKTILEYIGLLLKIMDYKGIFYRLIN